MYQFPPGLGVGIGIGIDPENSTFAVRSSSIEDQKKKKEYLMSDGRWGNVEVKEKGDRFG